jgi:hypothetical protein
MNLGVLGGRPEGDVVERLRSRICKVGEEGRTMMKGQK